MVKKLKSIYFTGADVVREIALLQDCHGKSEHVIELIGFFLEPPNNVIGIIFERLDGPNLEEHLKHNVFE